MAQRYNTGNPRPSNSMKDLNDNALAYDDFLNGEQDEAYDRFQKPFPTVRRQVADRIDEITGAQKSIEQYTDEAKQAADNAQNIADANTYYTSPTDPDGTIAGIAGTPAGKSFRVAIQDATLSVVAFNYYLNDNGTAEFITSYPNKRYLDMVNALAESTDKRTSGLNTDNSSRYGFELGFNDGTSPLYLDDDDSIVAPGGIKGNPNTRQLNVLDTVVSPMVRSLGDLMSGGVVISDDSHNAIEFVFNDGSCPFYIDPVTDKGVFPAGIDGQLGGGSLTPALNGDFFAIGDSIFDNGVAHSGPAATGDSWGPTVRATFPPVWASLESQGRIQFAGVSAKAGATVSQIATDHLPKALAAKPTFCLVEGGRNDVFYGISIDNVTIPTFESMFTTLMNAGIIPIVCISAAQNNDSNNTWRSEEFKLNSWLRAYAKNKRLPIVDFHKYTADASGNWLPGGSDDGVHPTVAGAKMMSEAIYDGLIDWILPAYQTIAEEQLSVAGLTNNKLLNPLFMNVTGTIPDGWVTTGSPTSLISTDPEVRGNIWTLTGNATQTVTVTPGKKMALGFKVKTQAGKFEFYAVAGNGDSLNHLAGIRDWWSAMDDWGYFYYEFIVPEGVTQVTVCYRAGAPSHNVCQAGLFELTEV